MNQADEKRLRTAKKYIEATIEGLDEHEAEYLQDILEDIEEFQRLSEEDLL